MRRLGRATLATVLASMMTLVPTLPAAAAVTYPKPMQDEWWFTAWEIQTKVWPVSQGTGVTVAVLDTGVQADIPELRGVVLPGTDATGGGGDGRTDKDDAPVPGHGTGMASLIAAQGGPTGFLGIAPRSKILPVTVHSSTAAIAPGIRYAVDHGAKVINISQAAAGSCPGDVQQAVGYAIEHDVVVVAGSGNWGNENNPSVHPANCAGVLAVGGIQISGQSFVPLYRTERQPYVAVAAPAGGVGSVLKDGEYHTSQGGTSSASALTSAVVALVRSKYPHMHAREVVQRIIASCRDITPSGKDDRTGYGAVRPMHALNDSVPKDTPNPVFAAYDRWKVEQGGGAVQSSGSKPATTSSSRRSPVELTLMALIPLAAIIVIIMLAVRSRRRRPRLPAGTPAPYRPVHQQQGPPPSFGPPSDSEPPRDGSRPSFEPPPEQGPPPGYGR